MKSKKVDAVSNASVKCMCNAGVILDPVYYLYGQPFTSHYIFEVNPF